MKTFIKITFFITFFFMTISCTGCGLKEEDIPKVTNLPHYSQVTAVENKDNTADVFKIENRSLYNIGNIENILNMVYNVKNSSYVYSVSIAKGQNFNNNKLIIVKDEKRIELKDFYAALDLRINSSGDKLAFRTFSKDSQGSAEGLKIYDIINRRYMDIKSKVLVSGDLYQWIDKNRIIYYGGIEGQRNTNKIYLYDFINNKEEVYLDNINGYCMYFIPINKDILFLARQGDKSKLYYYDSTNKNVRGIEGNIGEIYNSTANLKNGDIFLLAGEDEGNISLYRFSSQSLGIEKITYDFPKQVDVNSGLGLDEQGNIYFSGTQNESEKDKKDVFMYDDKEHSINLISNHEGKYSVYSSVQS